MQSAATLGSFKGTVSVKVTSESGEEVFQLENVSADKMDFTDVPKGKYTMTITWVDGAENTLTFPLTIEDKKPAPEGKSELKNAPLDYVASLTAPDDNGPAQAGYSVAAEIENGTDFYASLYAPSGASGLYRPQEQTAVLSTFCRENAFVSEEEYKRCHLRL